MATGRLFSLAINDGKEYPPDKMFKPEVCGGIFTLLPSDDKYNRQLAQLRCDRIRLEMSESARLLSMHKLNKCKN